MGILIKNGHLVDPDTKTDGMMDLYLEEGKIVKVAEKIEEKEVEADRVIDAAGCYVMPGLIDLHVHLRDPGLEHKETIETGSKAAAHGGFTTIVAMPNTKPVMDSADRISYVVNKAKVYSPIHVLQAGAITMGQKGETMTDIDKLVAAGAPAISEDGKSVMNAQIYKEAMKLAAKNHIPVLAHCEDINLVAGGCMNEDEKSKELGLPGISNNVEDVIVARDILLAQETGVHLHLCHCSTKGSVEMVKAAKEKGISVSAEVCPHHFAMSSDEIKKDDANYKMNPPLRTKEDVEALKIGLKNDIMEVISTDHAPHAEMEKRAGMKKAPFGIVGLETAVALTITELLEPGYLTPMQMAEKMSYNPAKILGIEKGSLAEGKAADVVIIDPKAEYCIDPKTFYSKGKNTPFKGKKVRGKVMMTICDGRIVWEEENDK